MNDGHKVVVCTTQGTLYVLNISGFRNKHRKIQDSDKDSNMEIFVEDKEDFDGELFSTPLVISGCILVGCRDNFLYSIKIFGGT